MEPDAAEKAQAFAHRLVEFAAFDKCIKFFDERQIAFDRANAMGWSILMSVCACGRDDLVGFVMDRTAAVDCVTSRNRTTVLHLTAMSTNTRVMEELVATANRQQKLRGIINQPNAHGDTALMMACVAKNVKAVHHLVTLGARMDLVNASGLNALMCAARVGQDPRLGALSLEDMMRRGAVIIKVLLANGAQANAVEKAGGNTALHLAVLSENVDAVESLIQNAVDLDITLRNKVGKTALDMSKQISGVAAVQMGNVLSDKWTQYSNEAAQRSAQMELELLDLAVEDPRNKVESKDTRRVEKKKTRKIKKRTKSVQKRYQDMSTTTVLTQDKLKSDVAIETNDDVVSTSLLHDTKAVEKGTLPSPDSTISEDGVDKDDGNWHSVLPRKAWRKDLGKSYEKSKSKEKPSNSFTDNSKTIMRTVSIPESILPQTTQLACMKLSNASLPASLVSETSWKMQIPMKMTSATATVSPRSQVLSEDDDNESSTSTIPYHVLNGSFHRTFPVADELEIDVEKFLIASSTSDRELEPYNSLSISQVEALQEAHWQAYHYLNEKKIELTRVLEAQRVEAQYALQQELMQMK